MFTSDQTDLFPKFIQSSTPDSDSHVPWFHFLPGSVEESLHHLNTLKLDIGSELFVCSFEDNSTTIEVREVYRRHPQERDVTVLPWGRWSMEEGGGGGMSAVEANKWRRRRDLSGLDIVVTTLQVCFFGTKN